MLKKLFWLIPPAVGIFVFVLYSGCNPQCVDSFDCRSFGTGYICNASNACVQGPLPAPKDAGSGGGQDSGATCSAANCATGCCNGTTCVTATGDTACGTNGAACTNCTTTSQVCTNGACTTPAMDSGTPTDGGLNTDAGIDAGLGCNSANCATGCCDAVGMCRTNGNRNKICGVLGTTCVDCTALTPPTTCDVTNAFCQCPDGGPILSDAGC
jgi:hypothetical protein